jgi:hypothetical protein
MSAIKLSTPSSGSISLSPADTASNLTITVPAVSATMATLTTPSFATTIGVGGATPAVSGAGITFPATQSASTDANTLDDYEEGTWTPTLTFGTGSTGMTYTARSGWYTKIGNQVTVQFTIFLSAIGSSTGSANVSGLPFTLSNDGYKRNGAYVFADRVTPLQILSVTNGTSIDLQTISSGPANSSTNITQSNFSNTTYLSCNFTYFV